MHDNDETAPTAGTVETAKSNYQDARTDNDTRPAVTVWQEYATDGIVPAPDVVEQTWGAALDRAPDWTTHVTDTGWAVSPQVHVPAEIHDGIDDHGNISPAHVTIAVLQNAVDRYPRVRLLLNRTFRDGKGHRRREIIAKVSLHPWEVQPLLDALSAARDLTEGEW